MIVEPEPEPAKSFKSQKDFHLNDKICWPEGIVYLHENPVVKVEPFLTAA